MVLKNHHHPKDILFDKNFMSSFPCKIELNESSKGQLLLFIYDYLKSFSLCKYRQYI